MLDRQLAPGALKFLNPYLLVGTMIVRFLRLTMHASGLVKDVIEVLSSLNCQIYYLTNSESIRSFFCLHIP